MRLGHHPECLPGDCICGREKDDDLIPTDWAVQYPACPVCGSDEDQQCSIPDPDRPGFGIELGTLVHRAREDA